MAEAFICDYVRTPIGRFGGVLSGVRTDDLAALPLKALMARHAAVDFAAIDDVILGCANQAGEDNRNVARMALLPGGAAGLGAGLHHQSPVRLGHGRRADRGARHPCGRGGAADRRRRGEHVARAVRVAEGADSVFPQRRDLRHHHRLALRQSADEATVRCRFDAGNGRRTSPRTSTSPAPTRTPSRCARRPGLPRRRRTGASPARSSR